MASPTRVMRLALELARKAEGRTAPNPLVGAVVVKGGRVVGRGYHRRAGAAHAEVAALRAAGVRARGSTLYATLEPCNHYGRTPPCCDAIVAAGVTRVVTAVRDPNPITNGRGIARLRRAGIRVTEGVLAEDARRLNAPFFKAMTSRMPYVVAKTGQSLDGKIATRHGESRWITSAAARRLGHQWRSRVDAILVGINTVLADDPALTVRGARSRAERPVKVIVDSRLRLPPTARCLAASSAPVLVATTVRAPARAVRLTQRGAEVIVFPSRKRPSATRATADARRRFSGERVPFRLLCRELVRRGIHSVLIEGGGEVLAGAFEARIVDRVVWCIAPIIIGGRAAPTSVGGLGVTRLAKAVQLAEVTVRRLGRDLCIEGRVVYPKA